MHAEFIAIGTKDAMFEVLAVVAFRAYKTYAVYRKQVLRAEHYMKLVRPSK